MYSARNNQLFNEILMAQKIITSFMLDIYQQFQVEFFMYNYREKKKFKLPSAPPPVQSKIAEIGTTHNMTPSKKFPFPSCESI